MNHVSKNKLLTWLVVLLLVANAATITMFWLDKNRQNVRPKGTPAEFLIKSLNLDSNQQAQLNVLRKAHRSSVQPLRNLVKESKEVFFDLLKEATVSDSIKQVAAKKISALTEEIDLVTFNHFLKVRAICRPDQQLKFDEIIDDVINMMGHQQEGQNGPPPGGGDGHRPPPLPGDSEGEGHFPPGPPEGDQPPHRGE
ncbi:MAG: Spy/CpxP family protein refolding chaperone [Ferruginibacter sp.]